MVTQGLPPEDVMTVLRFIGPGPRRKWERRRSVLAIFGRSPLGAEVSSRQLEARGEFSRGWACRVLKELRDNRVLLEVWPATGTRAAAYRVNPNIGEWREVPWKVTDLRLVVAEVTHVELLGAPNLRPVARSNRAYRDTVRTSGAVEAGSPRHNLALWRGQGGQTAPLGSASGAVSGGSARHGTTGGDNSSLPALAGRVTLAGGVGGSAAAAEAAPSFVRERASITAWAKKRAGLPFFAGENLDRLMALLEHVELEAIYDAMLAHEPDMAKSPAIRAKALADDVEQLVFVPDDERAQALADAPTYSPPPPPEPETPVADGPRLAEWTPGATAPVIPIEDRLEKPGEQARQALRRGLDSTPTEEVHQA